VIFLGVPVALAVAGSAVVIAFVTGMAIDLVVPLAQDHPGQAASPSVLSAGPVCSCGSSDCADTAPKPDRLFDFSRPRDKAREAVRFAVDLLKEIGS
jgi:hypothetical protein